jgi:hypothetical protein
MMPLLRSDAASAGAVDEWQFFGMIARRQASTLPIRNEGLSARSQWQFSNQAT